MKISYAITVCKEIKEIKKLISFLLKNKRVEDEIVVLFDKQNGTAEVWSYLQNHDIVVEAKSFKNHFADWKNYLNSLCSGDYIFQIDADELPSLELISILPELLTINEGVEIILVPRINTVEGLTQQHIDKWKWRVDDKGWVNWPDYQWRIYKNSDNIKWTNKVHEKLTGFKEYSTLPLLEQYALQHPKKIKKQEEQNHYYDTL